jgi:hypothetical protein
MANGYDNTVQSLIGVWPRRQPQQAAGAGARAGQRGSASKSSAQIVNKLPFSNA